MAKTEHLPWFKKAYKKYAKGQRFADKLQEEKSMLLSPSLIEDRNTNSQILAIAQL